MKADLFMPALSQLPPETLGVFGPISFKGYLLKHILPATIDTAAAISVGFRERLPASLRHAGAVVLRLGAASDGRGTQFALIGTPDRLDDFFLREDPGDSPGEYTAVQPPSGTDALVPYQVFPTLTEPSMVNLAFASGLLGYALNLVEPYPTAAPATGSSTYSFHFRPHTEIPECLYHANGQVEVDAVFLGRRRGVLHLFVLEAKIGAPRQRAKHKLVYPVLALSQRVPPAIPVIPVYMRMSASNGEVDYNIMECWFPDPGSGSRASMNSRRYPIGSCDYRSRPSRGLPSLMGATLTERDLAQVPDEQAYRIPLEHPLNHMLESSRLQWIIHQ